ncbi:MAG: hypothetical protein NTX90_16360, partial [Alphaproteobacteria bacterium]|nr:hypothetical protein [Alphaproteobacteria bacterium]
GEAITLASSIAASGQNITNLGTVTAGSTISLNGVTGQINGTNIAAVGTVSGSRGHFATLDGATPGEAITLASSIAASGQDITGVDNLGAVSVTASGNVGAGSVTAVGTVSGSRGSFTTLGGTTPGGSIALASSIIANGQNITNLGTVTAGSTITLNGGTGQISGTNISAGNNIAAVGTVSGNSDLRAGDNDITGARSVGTRTLTTTGLATLNSAAVTNNATIGGTLEVTDATTTNGITNTGNVDTGTLSTTGDATVGGNLEARTLAVNGGATVGDSLEVFGATTTFGIATFVPGTMTLRARAVWVLVP